MASHLVQAKMDQQLLPVKCAFVYMPFMHGEALADQHVSATHVQHLAQERVYLTFVTFAIKHREVIERFGRFPHRNALLGRVSTVEESEFLTQPGSSF